RRHRHAVTEHPVAAKAPREHVMDTGRPQRVVLVPIVDEHHAHTSLPARTVAPPPRSLGTSIGLEPRGPSIACDPDPCRIANAGRHVRSRPAHRADMGCARRDELFRFPSNILNSADEDVAAGGLSHERQPRRWIPLLSMFHAGPTFAKAGWAG